MCKKATVEKKILDWREKLDYFRKKCTEKKNISTKAKFKEGEPK